MITLIVITTRDYPLEKREDYSYCSISGMDGVLQEHIDLSDSETVKSLQHYPLIITQKPSEARRMLVWKHEKASWYNSMRTVMQQGFELVRIEQVQDDARFFVYVGPCTNGHFDISFGRDYTAAILSAALKDFTDMRMSYDRVILVAHDKDLVDEDGSGIVARTIFSGTPKFDDLDDFTVLKFQHEDSDRIWDSIIRPIRDGHITPKDCIGFVELVDALLVDMSPFYEKDSVTASYMQLLTGCNSLGNE